MSLTRGSAAKARAPEQTIARGGVVERVLGAHSARFRRIEQDKPTIRNMRHRPFDGFLVPGDTGDERRACHAGAIELLHPAIGEIFWRAWRIPSKLRDDVSGRLLRSWRALAAKRCEELLGEKVAVDVVHTSL